MRLLFFMLVVPKTILLYKTRLVAVMTPYKTKESDSVYSSVSAFLGMKAVFQSMRKTKNGSIVNISSLAGLVANKEQVAYVASKFAVRGMTKVAALEFAKNGIRVNSVHPGFIETPMIRQDSTEKLAKTFEKQIPLGIARPEEVSNLFLFLASDESSYLTGSEFVVDGGLLAQ
ncbi:SDR family NAD(P)-dependent oxidoreductase [Paenibacillus jiagnxiensis]|uniref:SDR family NAD(P)-dependent oxidoreductase n=1 Tax=Paenibacillus jiagnxiensis TaxID=3228926 RepID=UPI0033B1109B